MENERHPKGLVTLFLSEMWERFGFYLLLGILYLYLTDTQKGGLGWSDKDAAVLFGSYLALVYFTPFIGGLLADRLLGCRKTIVIGGVLMMLGYLVLAWPSELTLYLGLGLVILGNGAFKPNISTILGNLYPPGSKLRDSGYNIFYMGINIGAFACNFVAALVRNHFDDHPLQITSTLALRGWSVAFATAGIGMGIGLITFLINYRGLAKADPDPGTGTQPRESLQPLLVQCVAPAIGVAVGAYFAAPYLQKIGINISPINAAFLGACLPVILFYITIWRGVEDTADRARVGGLLTIFGVVIIFWAIFHLNGTALTAWTRDNTNREPGVVEFITNNMTEFAENAPPDYFTNAGPEVARPARETFEIVSEEEYKRLSDARELVVAEGKKVYVTQKMFDEVFKNTTPQTPILPPGQHLKLVNPELYQSINPAFVVLFTPLVVAFWHWMRQRGMEPSTSAKIGIGLLLTACGPLVMLAATYATKDGITKGTPGWLFATYALATFGELCLSPMGLSLVNKMSPANIRAFMMGGWFLSTSFGNKLSGIFGELYTEMNHYAFWPMLAISGGFFALLIFVLLPWLNRQMTERTY